jgi:hypothetical protein
MVLLAQKVAIEVVNTSSQWFTPYRFIPSTVQDALQEIVRRGKEYLPFKRYRQHPEQLKELAVASVIHWREPFSLDRIHFVQITDSQRGMINYSSLGEVSLWYGDRFGKDGPDVLGWQSDSSPGALIRRQGVFVAQTDLAEIIRGIEGTPSERRIPRTPNMTLTVYKDTITPEQAQAPTPQSEIPLAYIQGGHLHVKFEGLVLPQEVDVWKVYKAMERAYRSIAQLPAHVEQYPPIPRSRILRELKEQGFLSELDRTYAIKQLVRMHFLEEVNIRGHFAGYRPTTSGVATWNVIDAHI